MDKTIIAREEVFGIQNLLKSSDKENTFMGLSILENCDYIKSLPWLIVLYREMPNAMQKGLLESNPLLTEHLNKYLKVGDVVSVSEAFDMLKKISNSEDALKYIIEEKLPAKLKEQLVEWGFAFLKEYDLIIKSKTDADNTK